MPDKKPVLMEIPTIIIPPALRELDAQLEEHREKVLAPLIRRRLASLNEKNNPERDALLDDYLTQIDRVMRLQLEGRKVLERGQVLRPFWEPWNAKCEIITHNMYIHREAATGMEYPHIDHDRPNFSGN
jgi:hypothetical protein